MTLDERRAIPRPINERRANHRARCPGAAEGDGDAKLKELVISDRTPCASGLIVEWMLRAWPDRPIASAFQSSVRHALLKISPAASGPTCQGPAGYAHASTL